MSNEEELIPLVLKYKPKKLDDVLGRDAIINDLKAYLDQGFIPNILFEGLPGTGKTLIANLLIKEYYKGQSTTSMVLPIDASNDNNVGYMRDNLIPFSETQGMLTGYKKIIWMDEADNVTKDGWESLRRPIEKSLKKCTFISAANYVNQIIDPILNRFTIYSFQELEQKYIIQMVQTICNKEQIDIIGDEKQIYDLMYKYCGGTMRSVVNRFLEPARATGKLSLDTLKNSYNSKPDYIETVFSKNLPLAIQIGIQNPRGNLSGALEYIINFPDDKMGLPVKTKLIGWITDSYRDMTNNIPYHITITDLTYKIINAMTPKKK